MESVTLSDVTAGDEVRTGFGEKAFDATERLPEAQEEQLTRLLWYLDGQLFQDLNVLYAVQDWPENVDARLQNLVEFAHSLDHPGLLLANETDASVHWQRRFGSLLPDSGRQLKFANISNLQQMTSRLKHSRWIADRW